MARTDLAQAAGSHQFSGCAGPEQDGVPIELTTRDGKAGQRVVRIVLDYADESTGAGHAPHLRDELRPFSRHHVVHHADGRDHIEAGIVEWKGAAVKLKVVDPA